MDNYNLDELLRKIAKKEFDIRGLVINYESGYFVSFDRNKKPLLFKDNRFIMEYNKYLHDLLHYKGIHTNVNTYIVPKGFDTMRNNIEPFVYYELF